ncbi:PEP-CTERM/exosortase system-associated acyltransferase [Desulfuromonas thiophila]|uniref:PEP-CTERM/exosortase system-associated acyltransferase n=1 Tax=Desulfuromonas thiophila TaxID=57664 RepID=UPI0024A7D10A|nr:PEP-CTERM/exosortase system-associated acyltransferase [Desulfuromonas thiophila]
MNSFRFERVERDDPRMADLYRLRYQVYCTECGFERAEDHPGGLETDIYDPYSSHFCATVIETGSIVGAVRIILDSPLGFPIEKHCQLDPCRRYDGDPKKIGEISRLAISKEFRRREIDRAIYSQREFNPAEVRQVHEQRRQFECLIVAGLYQCVYQESLTLGLTHWYAVMVKGLCGLLRRWGIVWNQVGEQVEYHGLRVPYLAGIAENEKRVAALNPLLLERPCGWQGSAVRRNPEPPTRFAVA